MNGERDDGGLEDFPLDRDDAFGAELFAYALRKDPTEIVERDDGFIECSPSVPLYFLSPSEWPEHERKAIRLAHGRTVDVGCGAGRVSRYLQGKGMDVIAIDTSAGALEICRRSGIRNPRRMPFDRIDASLGIVDTWVLFCNNFGLFGTRDEARRLLGVMSELSPSDDAVILAETTDPYTRDAPEHVAYRERNRSLGRMPGQHRIRVRKRLFATPWFEYLHVSKAELEEIVDGTGWRIERSFDGYGGTFIAALRRERSAV